MKIYDLEIKNLEKLGGAPANGLFTKGHFPAEEFNTAIRAQLGVKAEAIRIGKPQHETWRHIPSRNGNNGYAATDPGKRGAFPVTVAYAS